MKGYWLEVPLLVSTLNSNDLNSNYTFRTGTNFLMRPVLRDNNTLSLVTPFETDSSAWASATCFNTADPSDKRTYRITTDMRDRIDSPELVLVKDFETKLRDYLLHPESKSLGPDGKPCTGRTRGLLQRTHVIAEEIIRMSKECPRGIKEGDEPTEVTEFVVTIYDERKNNKNPQKETFKPSTHDVQKLRRIGRRKLMRLGCSRRVLEKIRCRAPMSAEELQEFRQCANRSNRKGRK